VTVENRTEQFLAAEAEANRLIDELEALRRESEGFSTAASHLDKAGNELGRLSESMAQIAEGLRLSIQQLLDIGMPAILDSQIRIATGVDALQAESTELRTSTSRISEQTLSIGQAIETAAVDSREDRTIMAKELSKISRLVLVASGLAGVAALLALLGMIV
jgi:uncharacterized phage infection (PIP) family protein YhgE